MSFNTYYNEEGEILEQGDQWDHCEICHDVTTDGVRCNIHSTYKHDTELFDNLLNEMMRNGIPTSFKNKTTVN